MIHLRQAGPAAPPNSLRRQREANIKAGDELFGAGGTRGEAEEVAGADGDGGVFWIDPVVAWLWDVKPGT
jgi:hypothetical protein